MRLLYFDILDRLILTDFRGKPIPPYAILSHRWSDSETLIEDISNGTYKEKEEGYRKLRFCSEQAIRDGLQYFWIDTCCIDRWDNNERSKAINSMFQWYRNATRCYVYLSDVSLSAVAETAACSDWKTSFCASPWFTRGWTLQELIAPLSVEFFSREGQRIGDKASLEQLIHSITGIPLAALRNNPLDQFSTCERMRWAENRITTEKEDIVYCLLGLLGISMPVTYGEGQESARRRLQAELDATTSTPSIIPFSRNESFVGRESQLAELEAKLFSNDQTTTALAIVGLGGTGKSQLALEVAHRARLNIKDCLVFWIDVTDTDSLYRSYASVAQKLRVPGCDDDQADTKQIVKRCVAEVSTRQCLLIFDNVGDMNVRPGSSLSVSEAVDLFEFVPHSKLCSIIFTTTESSIAEALAPQNVTTLHNLLPDAALRMLQNRLTRPLSNIEQQGAMHLLGELSYSPLVIMQAAAHIEASGVTVQQYQAQLAKHREVALECGVDLSKGELQESDLGDIVATTLFLSMSQVRKSNVVAADYLFLTACIDRKDILLDLLDVASLQAREDAIKVLEKYALVTRRPAESAIDVHQLVHSALRKRLQVEERLQEWIRRTITQLLELFPNNSHNNRSKWRRLLPHARYILSHTQMDDNKERLDLARKCAMALYSDGQYKGAERLQLEVMQIGKRVLGNEHPDTLTSMGNLALIYRKQRRWREAEELQAQVMETLKKRLRADHPDMLTSMNNLALIYMDQGRWREAGELFLQVMQIGKRVLGKEHHDTLTSMGNLAMVHRDQGRWRKAKELQVQVMEIRKKLLGNKHPDTLTSMGNLALIYWSQGLRLKARELQVQVMETTKRVLGNEHPDTLTSMINLAFTYRKEGRWREAEELQAQVMETTKRVLGDEHPDTLTSMCNMVLIYQNQGRWHEMEKVQIQIRKTMKKVFGDEHLNTLASMANLALIYGYQGRWRKAEKLLLQVIEKMKRVLGDKHSGTLTCMDNLVSVYRNQGRWREAEELELQVMETRKRMLGSKYSAILASTYNLACTLWLYFFTRRLLL